MADVELSYKGSTIGSLSASGTLTMETQGKYCEDDITLTYTSPGGGGGYTADDFCDLTKPTGAVVCSASALQPAMFYNRTGITKFTGNNVTSLASFNYAYCHTFYGCTALEEVELPALTSIYDKSSVFRGCTSLRKINLQNLKSTGGSSVFYECSSLEGIVFPSAFSDNGNAHSKLSGSMFYNCASLAYFDTAMCYSIDQNVFSGCSVLDTIVIRYSPNTGASNVCTLSNINAFNNSPFASGGSGGTLYVPSAVKSLYEQATNWSTILGYANNSIAAIEGSYYETHYADGTTIPT